jgi:glutamine synthetase
LNAANEIEGFLFAGIDAERNFHSTAKFDVVNTGGYYHSLPGDPLRTFIDTATEVLRAMGFETEKDHPEVAPSQFEINYSYGEVVAAADQIQIYKLVCRQVANQYGLTASFLPKPMTGVNGSGMHTNVSISKDGKNIFWDSGGEENLSTFAWNFVDRILSHGGDICLMLNPSVNSYRRLDPHFEAPNQIKASAIDRGSMVRIPIGNEKSSRVEVRSVAPDANPYMVLYSIFRSGLSGENAKIQNLRQAQRYLPENIHVAMEGFQFWLDIRIARRRCEGPICRSKTGISGQMSPPSRNMCEDAGNSVSSRGLQPVPLEPVLIDAVSWTFHIMEIAIWPRIS